MIDQRRPGFIAIRTALPQRYWSTGCVTATDQVILANGIAI